MVAGLSGEWGTGRWSSVDGDCAVFDLAPRLARARQAKGCGESGAGGRRPAARFRVLEGPVSKTYQTSCQIPHGSVVLCRVTGTDLRIVWMLQFGDGVTRRQSAYARFAA